MVSLPFTGRIAGRFRWLVLGVPVLALGLVALIPTDLAASNLSFGSPDYWSAAGRFGWQKSAPPSVRLWTSFNPWSGQGAIDNGGSLPPPGTASLSGQVWTDVNRDGTPDKPILGAKTWLYQMSNLATPVAITSTDGQGVYRFDNLPAGQYGVALRFPNLVPGQATVGSVLDGQGNPDPGAAGFVVPGTSFIADIALGTGWKAEAYDFSTPVIVVSKREFLTPEPTGIALLATLAAAGAFWAGRRWLGRRRHHPC